MNTHEKHAILSALNLKQFSIIDCFKDHHEGVTITDENGVVLFMNKTQLNMDDFTIKQIIGKSVTYLYKVDEGKSPTMACLKTGKAIRNLAIYYRTHLGRYVNSIHNIYPVTVKGKVLGCICYIIDFKNIEYSFDAVMNSKKTSSHPFYSRGSKTNGTRFTFNNIIGGCRELINAVKTAKLASVSSSPILIYGETGTGKELFAQSIHNSSPRKKKPFMAINCASIPETLLEGLLFGTSKGAFTGAVEKAGLFEKANGGTVLLDEINSMPLTLQAKILRFLQERKIRRVGSMREMSLDLKIISTINIPPEEAIETKTIRPDLYYRIAVVVVRIPSLAKRGDDVDLLANHFLLKKNQLLGKQVVGFSLEIQKLFKEYHWPGNVRELEHLIEGAMNLVGPERVIEKYHLPEVILASHQNEQIVSPLSYPHFTTASTPETTKVTQKKTLAELKLEHEVSILIAELRATQGQAAKAARNIGISPQMMNYKLKRFKINRKDFV